MALSNIFNEPRRELTEQLFGLLPFAIVAGIVYGVGCWLEASCSTDWLVAALCSLIGLAVIFVLTFFAHFIGEEVCAALARAGLDPRPKRK